MSLKDVADAAGTTVATVSRIETGCRAPSFSLAARLSRATGLPLEEFLAGTPPEPAEVARQ